MHQETDSFSDVYIPHNLSQGPPRPSSIALTASAADVNCSAKSRSRRDPRSSDERFNPEEVAAQDGLLVVFSPPPPSPPPRVVVVSALIAIMRSMMVRNASNAAEWA